MLKQTINQNALKSQSFYHFTCIVLCDDQTKLIELLHSFCTYYEKQLSSKIYNDIAGIYNKLLDKKFEKPLELKEWLKQKVNLVMPLFKLQFFPFKSFSPFEVLLSTAFFQQIVQKADFKKQTNFFEQLCELEKEGDPDEISPFLWKWSVDLAMPEEIKKEIIFYWLFPKQNLNNIQLFEQESAVDAKKFITESGTIEDKIKTVMQTTKNEKLIEHCQKLLKECFSNEIESKLPNPRN